MGIGTDFPLESGWNPADRELIRASVATLVLATKSPLNWGCAHRPEGSLFGYWRSGMEFTQVSCRSTRRGVREHLAPSGALRLQQLLLGDLVPDVREHLAPSGALRLVLNTVPRDRRPEGVREHPAPSGALRLVGGGEGRVASWAVRAHPAPSGALRHSENGPVVSVIWVREHPAPSGALRRWGSCTWSPYQ